MKEINSTLDSNNEKVKFAGFWIRAVAYLIDGILFSFILFLIYFLSSGYEQAIYKLFEDSNVSIFDPLTWIVSFFYTTLMNSSKYQATLGKICVGVVVVDTNGYRISFLKATGRFFAEILSMIVLCLGYIMVVFSERKQSLHDKIAGTYVVYKKKTDKKDLYW